MKIHSIPYYHLLILIYHAKLYARGDPMTKLTPEFFLRDTVEVARDLLGRYLVRNIGDETMVCRITETEAYIGAIDKACHAYGGRKTERTQTLYASPGTAYVYQIYGMYHCLNFVTEPEGIASAVLIRGCTPVYNENAIAKLRYGINIDQLSRYQRRNFMNGPGKLCKGLAIDKTLNNTPCGDNSLFLADEIPEFSLPRRKDEFIYHTGKRIGIDYAEEAVDFPWRFWTTEDKLC